MKSAASRIRAIPRAWLSASLWSALLQVFVRGAALATFSLLAVSLQPAQLGLLLAAQSAGITVAALWDFGTGSYIAREASAQPGRLVGLIRQAMTLRLALLPPVALTLGLLSLGYSGAHGLRGPVLLMIASAVSACLGTVPDAALQSQLRFAVLTNLRSASRVAGVAVAGAMAVGLLPADPTTGALALSLPDAIYAVTGFLAMRTRERNRLDSGRLRDLAHGSWPYAVNGIAIAAYNRLDVYLVGAILGAAQAGLFAPASKIQDVLLAVPAVVTAGAVPLLTRLAHDEHGSARQTTRRLAQVSFAATTGAAFLAVVAVWTASALGFAGDYLANPWIATLGAISVIPVAISMPLSSYLVAQGRVAQLTRTLVITLVLATGLLILFGNIWGLIGAAVVVVIREVIVLALLLHLTLRVPDGPHITWQRETGARPT